MTYNRVLTRNRFNMRRNGQIGTVDNGRGRRWWSGFVEDVISSCHSRMYGWRKHDGNCAAVEANDNRREWSILFSAAGCEVGPSLEPLIRLLTGMSEMSAPPGDASSIAVAGGRARLG
jgi:hypothetical protein